MPLARALFETIEDKKEVIQTTKPISFDDLKTLYLDAFNRIGWQYGLMARPEVQKAEDKLNQVWLDCMEGKATPEDFKDALKGWEGTISGVIRERVGC
jgi:hypothetical protein